MGERCVLYTTIVLLLLIIFGAAVFAVWYWDHDPSGLLATQRLARTVGKLDVKVVQQNSEILELIQLLQAQIDDLEKNNL